VDPDVAGEPLQGGRQRPARGPDPRVDGCQALAGERHRGRRRQLSTYRNRTAF
jgi:hypothetical protein